MAFLWLMNWLDGKMALVDVPVTAGPPAVGGTALYVDATGINFIDGTNMDWIS